jgi:DNA-binding NarL/FixJ family response regulator
MATLLDGAGFACVEAASGEAAIALAREQRPRLVLLDIRLPDVSGSELCSRLREEFGEALAIVFLSADRTEPMDLEAGFLIGADDYLAKPFDPGELLARVRRLVRRAPDVEAAPVNGHEMLLTQRESEVLSLLAAGLGTKQIADELVISDKTVSTHLQRVLGKLRVNTRAQAVALAYRAGLIKAAGADPRGGSSTPRRRRSDGALAGHG